MNIVNTMNCSCAAHIVFQYRVKISIEAVRSDSLDSGQHLCPAPHCCLYELGQIIKPLGFSVFIYETGRMAQHLPL